MHEKCSTVRDLYFSLCSCQVASVSWSRLSNEDLTCLCSHCKYRWIVGYVAECRQQGLAFVSIQTPDLSWATVLQGGRGRKSDFLMVTQIWSAFSTFSWQVIRICAPYFNRDNTQSCRCQWKMALPALCQDLGERFLLFRFTQNPWLMGTFLTSYICGH